MNREARQAILNASTMDELNSSLENTSVLDLSIVAGKLGVDVNSIRNKHFDMEWLELKNAIIEAKRQEMPNL